MGIYTYVCGDCGLVQEKVQSMHDYHYITCDCGEEVYQDLSVKGVTFSGEMPTTGGFAPFKDGETGLFVTSQKMWDDVRKRTKRVQWEPDPEHQRARDEAVYLAKHSKAGDREAEVAAHRVMKDVHRKKAEKRVEKGFEGANEHILRETSSVDIAEE